MSIGQRLKTLRKEAGLSQKQVAEALKMSKPIVSQYESDQRTPSVPKLIRFSRFYKASLDYICENVEKKDELIALFLSFFHLTSFFIKRFVIMNLSLKNTYSFLYENELKNIKERDFSHQQLIEMNRRYKSYCDLA